MPTNSSPTLARAWGTRFDSLPLASSPPASPTNHVSAHDISFRDDERNASQVLDRRKDNKMPHDASVFVGSLPVNMDQTELARLLSVHLSEHAEVKNVKVVHDSKGGVCAFVQCQDAAGAASLIQTLHSAEPKPFLGRHLRYEPARAFRALLISYRSPTQFIADADGTANDDGKGGKHVDLSLPCAMRLWKPKNSKYPTILYNSEAIEAESQASVSGRFEANVEHSLHLQPVTCDVETVRTLCEYFGPLDTFQPWKQSEDVDPENKEAEKRFPYPHNARKSDNMESGCFEIKWMHRDDCVNALMTLRRVPHLTVTWAHLPNSSGQHFPHQNHRSQDIATYPIFMQDREHDRGRSATGSFSVGSSRDSITSTSFAGNGSHSSVSDRWKGGQLRTLPQRRGPADDMSTSSSIMTTTLNSSDAPIGQSLSGQWGDSEFPPLSNEGDWGVWSEESASHMSEEKTSILRSSMSSVSLSDNTDSRTYAMHEHPFAAEKGGNVSHDVGQELDMPPTPGLGMSPITPRTSGSMFPPTPTTADGDFHAVLQFSGYDDKGKLNYHSENQLEERTLDRTTLFVGGLEMYGSGAWDEEKVGNFFQKFGGLESVKVVRPVNGKAAFAFVKFNNTESPARAVSEVHNRIHEGRAMRVQLRDCNPTRGNWKYGGRGRGRYPVPGSLSHRQAYGDPHSSYRREQGFPRSFDNDEVHSFDHGSTFIHATDDINSAAPHQSEAPDVQEVRSTSNTDQSSETPETYREWYDSVPASATMTPPPVSFQGPPPVLPSSATSGPGFPVHPGVYYPPPPWVQPFGQHMQYPLAFYGGYTGHAPNAYMAAQLASGHGYSSNTGSDASGPASVAPTVANGWPAMGMFGAYIPYPTFPARPTPSEYNANQPSVPQAPQQPPVVPSGFIQNEQGTLIPVYPPEAIDQYMTAGSHPFPVTQPQTPQVFPNGSHLRLNVQSRQIPPNVQWMPVAQPSTGFSQQTLPQSSNTSHDSQAFRGHDVGAQHLNPSFRRNSARREPYTPTKNPTRTAPVRNNRLPVGQGGGPMFNNHHHHHAHEQRAVAFPVGTTPSASLFN